MSVAGVHPHGSLEIAELLAELAARGERVVLDHIVLELEPDAQGAPFAELDEGEYFAGADDIPLGFIDLIAVEIVGEDEFLANRRIRGESRRDQAKEGERAHGDYL